MLFRGFRLRLRTLLLFGGLLLLGFRLSPVLSAFQRAHGCADGGTLSGVSCYRSYGRAAGRAARGSTHYRFTRRLLRWLLVC